MPVVLYVLCWAVSRLADLLLSRWWFDSVTDAPVWSTKLAAQAWMTGIAAAITAGVLGATVLVTLRSRPVGRWAGWVDRYHGRVGPAHRWGAAALVAVLTWKIAAAASGLWQQWSMFWNARDLGIDVPEIGHDLGYYLYRLPLLDSTTSWLRQLLLVCMLIAVIGHLLSGALQLPGAGRRTSPVVIAHLALLGAGLFVVQAVHNVYVAKGLLSVNRSGSFDGPGFVQLRITSPGLYLLALGAVGIAALLIDAVRRSVWRPALIGVGTWVVLHGLLVWALPAVVQSLVVQPAEATRELPYITHNLEATRRAYRLDVVDQTTQTFTDGLAEPPTEAQSVEIDRVPLFDSSQLVQSFQVLQGTTATRISDIDLDRYEIDGERRAVLVAARNVSQSDLPESGWVQSHLVYTHGSGIVAAPADVPAADGRPDLGTTDLAPERSELYFGEGLADWYAIVGTKRDEQGGVRFDADTGIPLSTTWRRLVTALSTGEANPLLSAELTSDSQLLMKRGIRERLDEIAPFLSFDANAYPAVADGRIVWIIDGYTTSASYPYAQFAPTAGLSSSSGLTGTPFNYLHASIKATVDAYSGEVHLYRTEVGGADDPVLDVWTDVFPGLVEPIATMPEDLRAHLRYPADLFTVQSNLLGRYHVDSPEALFDGTQRWSVSPASPASVSDSPSGISDEVSLFAPAGNEFAGDWVAVRTFNPGASSNKTSARDGLAAFAVADHDDGERVTLVDVDSPTNRQITSPQVAQSTIDADPDLAREFTFLNSNGSKVTFGPMTMVPLDGAIVWLRPIIVTGTSPTSTPHLYKVVVVSGGSVGQGATASEALADAVGG